MKKLALLIAAFSVAAGTLLNAQAPAQMNYQAVVRDANGNPLTGGLNISIRFIIHDGSVTGTNVFSEEHNVVTNNFGLVSLQIGSSGDLAQVNWANGDKFLQVEIDPTGGTNYTDMGTTQLVSVPYALFAGNNLAGPPGATGSTGPSGADGVGVSAVIANNDGTMTVVLTDGSRTVVPLVTGATGATGPTGPANGPTGSTGPTGATGGIPVDSSGNAILGTSANPAAFCITLISNDTGFINPGDLLTAGDSSFTVARTTYLLSQVVGVSVSKLPVARGFPVTIAVAGACMVNVDGAASPGDVAEVDGANFPGHCVDIGGGGGEIIGTGGLFGRFISPAVNGKAWIIFNHD